VTRGLFARRPRRPWDGRRQPGKDRGRARGSPPASLARTVAAPTAGTILLALAGVLVAPGATAPNGLAQREIQGRVESLDARTGRMVVARTFRGQTTRVALEIPGAVQVFACHGEPRDLDLELARGTLVSVFYEVVGSDGIANLIVVEARP
jgi:hypothetical protein